MDLSLIALENRFISLSRRRFNGTNQTHDKKHYRAMRQTERHNLNHLAI